MRLVCFADDLSVLSDEVLDREEILVGLIDHLATGDPSTAIYTAVAGYICLSTTAQLSVFVGGEDVIVDERGYFVFVVDTVDDYGTAVSVNQLLRVAGVPDARRANLPMEVLLATL